MWNMGLFNIKMLHLVDFALTEKSYTLDLTWWYEKQMEEWTQISDCLLVNSFWHIYLIYQPPQGKYIVEYFSFCLYLHSHVINMKYKKLNARP